MKSGFVAVLGRPNAGKSTLLNWLSQEKLLLVSHKANATRRRADVIVMHGDNQIVFVDTPGLHEREKLLNKFMLTEALKAHEEADCALFLIDVFDDPRDYEKFLELSDKPHILVCTKTDKASPSERIAAMERFKKYSDRYKAFVLTSTPKNIGRKELLDTLVKLLPEHPYFYDPEILSTQHIREIYRELIREALFNGLSDEIPYECDVIIEKIDEREGMDVVKASIVANHDSQKGMIIGKNGEAIKRIGKNARISIERFSGKKIYLELFVKVVKNWVTNPKHLEEMGYGL